MAKISQSFCSLPLLCLSTISTTAVSSSRPLVKKKLPKLLSKTHETPWSPELPVDLARRGTWEEVCLLLCGEQLGKNPRDSVAYLDIIINSWHSHILKTPGQLHLSTLLRSQFNKIFEHDVVKGKVFRT